MTVEHLLGPDFGTVGDRLSSELGSQRWSRLTGVVAFARMSGVRHLESRLRGFVAGGGRADLTIGVDLRSTTYEAAWYLMHSVAGRGRMLLASSEPGATFHPKVYVFSNGSPADANVPRALRSATDALVITGSSNITGGGLFGNDEASTVWTPPLADQSGRAAWLAFVGALSPWVMPSGSTIIGKATKSRLLSLARAGTLPAEMSVPATRPRGPGSAPKKPRPRQRKRPPKPPPLAGPSPPALKPPTPTTPPGLSVLVARMTFGGSRRWPQWELNKDVLSAFFGLAAPGSVITREGVTRAGKRLPAETTPLVIGSNKNRRLEFPEPDHRPDPAPGAALLVAVDRRPGPFRYAVLLPGDAEYAAVEALNRATPPLGQYVEATRRVVVPFAALTAVWPGCPL